MLTWLVALLLSAEPHTLTPDEVFRLGRVDQSTATAPADRPYVRYLSLAEYPAERRVDLTVAITFLANSTSYRRTYYRPSVVADGNLIRIDLRELEWDRYSRADKLARLEKSGVKFAFKSDAERASFLDPWERFAAKDPYFRVTVDDGKGHISRGWLDPKTEYDARVASYSSKFLLRADWFLTQAALDRPRGFYSDLLMLPGTEAELYRSFGVDEQFVRRERLNQGGAVLSGTSIVAHHNRELELLPSLFGFDQRFIWRTYDTLNDLDRRDVLQNFAGTVKQDGREIIGSLPNGLHWYYLADAAGKQALAVPIDIARDLTPGETEPQVINAYKCIQCHGAKGINGFSDKVGEISLKPGLALATISKDPAAAAHLRRKLEDYYRPAAPGEVSGATELIRAHQASYAARVKALSGLDPAENGSNFMSLMNAYLWGTVGRADVIREYGVPEGQADSLFISSGNAQLLAIYAGNQISREAFEHAFASGALGRVYGWELPQKHH